ncbi:hypothetical protein LTS18_010550, partial [Coniosporium uncinatum]
VSLLRSIRDGNQRSPPNPEHFKHAPPVNNLPAYWSRPSRFVKFEDYGKGKTISASAAGILTKDKGKGKAEDVVSHGEVEGLKLRKQQPLPPTSNPFSTLGSLPNGFKPAPVQPRPNGVKNSNPFAALTQETDGEEEEEEGEEEEEEGEEDEADEEEEEEEEERGGTGDYAGEGFVNEDEDEEEYYDDEAEVEGEEQDLDDMESEASFVPQQPVREMSGTSGASLAGVGGGSMGDAIELSD